MLNCDVRLVDGEQRHREHPETFEIPAYEEIGRVHRGDSVKIGLEAPGVRGERFWVTVTDIRDRSFTGTVDNDLVHPYRWGVNYGDEVAFEAKHILSVMTASEMLVMAASAAV